MIDDFHSPNRARQLVSFAGLGIGRMRPTDVDFLYDLKGKGWLLGELKTYGPPLSTGQRIMLERLGDQLAGLRVAFFARHSTPVDETVRIADSLIELTRRNNETWELHVGPGVTPFTLGDLLQQTREELGI